MEVSIPQGESSISIDFNGSNSWDDGDMVKLVYHWDFDDGNTSVKTGDPMAVNEYTEGVWTVLLIVEDEEGATSEERGLGSVIQLAETIIVTVTGGSSDPPLSTTK